MIIVASADNAVVRDKELSALVASHAQEDVEVTRVDNVAALHSQVVNPSLFAEERLFVLSSLLPAESSKKLLEIISILEETDSLIVMTNKITPTLKKDVESAGGTVLSLSAKNARESAGLLLSRYGANIPRSVQDYLISHVGEDYEMLYEILGILEDNFENMSSMTVSQVVPLLPEPGSLPPWEMLDGIDASNPARALRALNRMLLSSSPRNALFLIHSHLERIFRLSSAGITNDKQGAEFLGLKGSTYPALKAIRAARSYGNSLPELMKLANKAIADIDFNNGTAGGLPPRTVAEILVGRLCTFPRR